MRSEGGVETEKGIEFKGWRIESVHERMARETELETLRAQLGDVLKLPEIIFLNNTLQLRHSNGLQFSFNAADALKQWMTENLPPLQVSPPHFLKF